MDDRRLVGRWGEALAAEYYRKKHYRTVEVNYTCRFGEIDLIVRNKLYIVFVEVKLRKSDSFARAAEYVDRYKQERLRTTAQLWLSCNETELQPRFDVLEIYAPEGMDTKKPKFNWIEDAFQ